MDKALQHALDDVRDVLSVRGQSSVLGWTLLYAAKEHLAGRDCIGYRGIEGTTQLLADVADYMGRSAPALAEAA